MVFFNMDFWLPLFPLSAEKILSIRNLYSTSKLIIYLRLLYEIWLIDPLYKVPIIWEGREKYRFQAVTFQPCALLTADGFVCEEGLGGVFFLNSKMPLEKKDMICVLYIMTQQFLNVHLWYGCCCCFLSLFFCKNEIMISELDI